MRSQKAVLLADVHFSLNTLGLSTSALEQAIEKAQELGVSLIIAGDLHDSKAIIRAECAKTLIQILSGLDDKPIILVGNHDLVTEKNSENHALEFLRPYAHIIDEFAYHRGLNLYFIPYQPDVEKLKEIKKEIPPGSTVIMHQGIKGAFMGEYSVDRTSIDPDELKDYRVFAGHYHRHQTIGTITYVGSPYTTSFAEANDGPKGFQILHWDNTLELVPTNLRKHVIVERRFDQVLEPIEGLNSSDLLWLKVSGPTSELDRLSKKEIGMKHLGHVNFKFDKIYDEAEISVDSAEIKNLTNAEILDSIVDKSEETEEQKVYLKSLWREIML